MPPEPSANIGAREVAHEVRDLERAQERRRHLMPRALLVGLLVGLVAVAFRRLLDASDHGRNQLIAYAHLHPAWGFLLPISLGAIGGAIAVALVQTQAPEAAGSGIPHLKAVLDHLRGLLWKRIVAVKFVGGVCGIGAGLALGREGPTVQMGGALGQMASEWLGSSSRERQTLIAAGAGAGLAAAFNAPLAGLVFVLEELQRDFTPTVFTATFVAAVTADVVTRLLTDQLPVFHVAATPLLPLSTIPVFVVLGLLAGVTGVVFNRTLLGSLNLFQRLQNWPPGLGGALVGAAVGLVGWFVPQALGGGQPLVESTLTGHQSLRLLPLLFVIRGGLTMFSYGCGAPGGIFAPLLVLGAQLGLLVGKVTQSFWPELGRHPEAFATVGMAAYFTAIVRAPLTGIVLITEMTGNYALMLPLLVACFAAYGMADLLQDRPIYEALLERDLLRNQERS